MARKTVERNISYDDIRHLYYVSIDLGRDENGKRIKQYRTFPTLAAARNGLKEFHATREQPQFVPAQEMTLSQWLEYWMDSIVRPNRAETTVYAYQKIIDNHIDPALGDTPLTKLSAKQVQEYYMRPSASISEKKHTPHTSPASFGSRRPFSKKADAHWAMVTSAAPPSTMAASSA